MSVTLPEDEECDTDLGENPFASTTFRQTDPKLEEGAGISDDMVSNEMIDELGFETTMFDKHSSQPAATTTSDVKTHILRPSVSMHVESTQTNLLRNHRAVSNDDVS